MQIWLKRAYEKPGPQDGTRILVDRPWPSGIRKMVYFSEHEKEAMLKEGYESDSGLIHQEYSDMVSTL